MSAWKIDALNTVGTISTVSVDAFFKIIEIKESGFVVASQEGFFEKNYKYFTCVDGIYFYCVSKESLIIPGNIEIIVSKKIYIPKFIG